MRNYRVSVNGHVYEIGVEFLNETSLPPAPKKKESPPSAPAEAPKAVPTGSGAVVSPLPGKIVELCVGEGENVKKGQTVLILEAMKMENEVVAPQAGIVKKLFVEEGDAVGAGEALFEIAQS